LQGFSTFQLPSSHWILRRQLGRGSSPYSQANSPAQSSPIDGGAGGHCSGAPAPAPLVAPVPVMPPPLAVPVVPVVPVPDPAPAPPAPGFTCSALQSKEQPASTAAATDPANQTPVDLRVKQAITRLA
jgi:hypothetical protein